MISFKKSSTWQLYKVSLNKLLCLLFKLFVLSWIKVIIVICLVTENVLNVSVIKQSRLRLSSKVIFVIFHSLKITCGESPITRSG